MREAAERDGAEVAVWVEQEPGSGGKESAEASIRNLAGYIVHSDRVTGDKVSRAQPFAAQCEAGNVRLLRGAWNQAYLEELCAFPLGSYADQVDASAGAFNKLSRDSGWSIEEIDRTGARWRGEIPATTENVHDWQRRLKAERENGGRPPEPPREPTQEEKRAAWLAEVEEMQAKALMRARGLR